MPEVSEKRLAELLEGEKNTKLAPHLPKFREDVREFVAESLRGRMRVSDAGVVEDPAALVDEMLKNKPALKAANFKDGTGTTKHGGGEDRSAPSAADRAPPGRKAFSAAVASALTGAAQEHGRLSDDEVAAGLTAAFRMGSS